MSLRRDDLHFLLYDWLHNEALLQRPRWSHMDRDGLDAMLDAALELAEREFAPHAAKADAYEPVLRDGQVQLIPEIGRAVAAYREAGFFAMHAPLAEDGLQLPYSLISAIGGTFSAACSPINSYPFLTQAAGNLIREFASSEQQARYLPAMNSGRWFGTMCLSEPHAGSSVGDIRCAATPRADGRYAIRGQKMWISCGEHELGGNIVHLVLAKIPGGPAGTRGISLFIVPRYRADDGGDNHVRLVGLNHKMGYRGAVNCLLEFGGDGECVGELVGEEHQGMRLMFLMMNEARIGVGIGAAVIGYAGHLAALAYARERTQGRVPSQKDPATPMQPLAAHADIRRMLLQSKSYVEGALALCLYAARLVDDAQTLDGEAAAEAQALLDLLTPIVKAWPSDYGLLANQLAIQVLGGAGYTRDFPVERLYRDNRLNSIHEGTNGIQAIDLLGRKILGDGGKGLGLLLVRMQATLAELREDAGLAPLARLLADFLPPLQAAVQACLRLAREGDIDAALANATPLMNALGHAVVAWHWLQQAQVADRLVQGGGVPQAQREFLRGKQLAAEYFLRWELPAQRSALERISAGDRLFVDCPAAVL